METKDTKKGVFETLVAVNCNEHAEKKNGLTYLSWSWAWQLVKELYPTATYTVRDWDGRPYLYDQILGYMVETTVTIEGENICMRLPVMDNTNKAMKAEDYTYKVWDGYKKQYIEKWVKAATMFDVNTAIMRCLVKNLAMFGLGLYIYAGEDLPAEVVERPEEQPAPVPAVAARKKAASRSTKAAPAPVQTYEPLPMEDYWKIVKAYAEGRKSKTGGDLRAVWIEKTHAGEDEITNFDTHVDEYKSMITNN